MRSKKIFLFIIIIVVVWSIGALLSYYPVYRYVIRKFCFDIYQPVKARNIFTWQSKIFSNECYVLWGWIKTGKVPLPQLDYITLERPVGGEIFTNSEEIIRWGGGDKESPVSITAFTYSTDSNCKIKGRNVCPLQNIVLIAQDVANSGQHTWVLGPQTINGKYELKICQPSHCVFSDFTVSK